MTNKFSPQITRQYITEVFDTSVVQSLKKYISITNSSRQYDPNWNLPEGRLQQAAQCIIDWLQTLEINGLKTQIYCLEGKSPIIKTQIKGDLDFTVFYYGHYDKQPPFEGWTGTRNPYIPTIQIDQKNQRRLYGRGGADDGYSTYSTMLSIKALQKQGIPIPRCVMITQGDEQSGDFILSYIEDLKQWIGSPEIVFCLDSGTVDYKTFTLTNSLRGYLSGVLKVQLIKNGVHSGSGSGLVADSFRVARSLISRLQNEKTGQIIKQFNVNIPPQQYKNLYQLALREGMNAFHEMPLLQGVQYVSNNPLQLLINNGWKPQLTVTGASGFPLDANGKLVASTAGNVLRQQTSFKLSLRTPPTLDKINQKQSQIDFITRLLTQNPPYNAKVQFLQPSNGKGWVAPKFSQYLQKAILQSTSNFFDNIPPAYISQGGSIPLLGFLSNLWPKAQFLVTGVLGPESNAHGPDEFLNLDYCIKLTCAMSNILANVSGVLGKPIQPPILVDPPIDQQVKPEPIKPVQPVEPADKQQHQQKKHHGKGTHHVQEEKKIKKHEKNEKKDHHE